MEGFVKKLPRRREMEELSSRLRGSGMLQYAEEVEALWELAHTATGQFKGAATKEGKDDLAKDLQHAMQSQAASRAVQKLHGAARMNLARAAVRILSIQAGRPNFITNHIRA
jgi:hypothetical protein